MEIWQLMCGQKEVWPLICDLWIPGTLQFKLPCWGKKLYFSGFSIPQISWELVERNKQKNYKRRNTNPKGWLIVWRFGERTHGNRRRLTTKSICSRECWNSRGICRLHNSKKNYQSQRCWQEKDEMTDKTELQCWTITCRSHTEATSKSPEKTYPICWDYSKVQINKKAKRPH